ncbi:hypothetical protein RI129_002544 [Pyrocoelia pectoralis]|uniref:Uncharacterized protein n=1 Tax=Pyrocoelia pectoralis TaxID=417401 RepID=A0AAN7VGR4_9COLE
MCCTSFLGALLSFFIIAPISHSVITNYKSIIEDFTSTCITESNVEPTMVHDMIHNGNYVSNRALQCYLRCMYLKIGLLDEKGVINETAVKENAGVTDERIREHVVQSCRNVKGRDLCEKAYNLSKCTYYTVKSWHP